MLSYWEQTSFFPLFDFAVVGAGITGLSAALTIKQKQPSARVVVLERGILPAGASVKNAGFACFGSPTELLDDLDERSAEEVFSLVEQRWKGLAALRQMLGDEAMGYAALGARELFCTPQCSFFERDDEAWEKCLDQLDFLNEALQGITGYAQTFQPEPAPSYLAKAAQSIRIRGEAQINTGKMMKTLLRRVREAGVEVYGGVEVQRWEESSGALHLLAKGLKISATQVLIAVNGFAARLLNLPDLQPARNQVLVAEVKSDLPWQGNFHYQRGYFYFRSLGKRHLLLGGGRHLFGASEMTDEQVVTKEVQQVLERFLGEVISPKTGWKVRYRWSGILGVGSAKHPILRRLSKRLSVAVRLGGMGVALGCETGKKAAAMLL